MLVRSSNLSLDLRPLLRYFFPTVALFFKKGFATRTPNEFGRGPLLLFLKDQLKWSTGARRWQELTARATVLGAGKTLIVCAADVHWAAMLGTVLRLPGKADRVRQGLLSPIASESKIKADSLARATGTEPAPESTWLGVSEDGG